MAPLRQKYPAAHGPAQAAEVVLGPLPNTPGGHQVHVPEPATEYLPASQRMTVALVLPWGQA